MSSRKRHRTEQAASSTRKLRRRVQSDPCVTVEALSPAAPDAAIAALRGATSLRFADEHVQRVGAFVVDGGALWLTVSGHHRGSLALDVVFEPGVAAELALLQPRVYGSSLDHRPAFWIALCRALCVAMSIPTLRLVDAAVRSIEAGLHVAEVFHARTQLTAVPLSFLLMARGEPPYYVRYGFRVDDIDAAFITRAQKYFARSARAARLCDARGVGIAAHGLPADTTCGEFFTHMVEQQFGAKSALQAGCSADLAARIRARWRVLAGRAAPVRFGIHMVCDVGEPASAEDTCGAVRPVSGAECVACAVLRARSAQRHALDAARKGDTHRVRGCRNIT